MEQATDGVETSLQRIPKNAHMRMCMLNRMNAIPAKFADWSANDAGAFR
jgi:hypothetical protein